MAATDFQQIIITGASGWLGRTLIRCLLDRTFPELTPDAPIRAFVKPEEAALLAPWKEHLTIIEGDLTNPDACKKLMTEARDALVIHTAGFIHPRRVSDFYRVNVSGTENLIASLNPDNTHRLVAVSSNSPCGCNPYPEHIFTEESPYRPYMNYGRSKMLMEKRLLDSGAPRLRIIRAPWFYGPLQPPRQKLFFEMIQKGKVPVVGDGTNPRSMAYTENLAQGILRAAVNDESEQTIFWIADLRPYSMNEIIETVESLLEDDFGIPCAHKRMKLPHFAGEIATAADWLIQRTGLYHQKMHVLSEMNKTIACSVELARKELGYAPQVDLRAGMRASLQEIFDREPGWLKA